MANLPQFSLWNTCSPVICSLWFILCNKGTLNRRSLFRQNSSSRKRAQKNVPIMVPSARKAGLRRCSSLSQHAEKCIRNFSGHPSFSHINFIYFVLILHPSLHWTLAPSHSPDIILPQLFLTFTFWISTPACSHYGEHYSEQGLQHVRAPACSSPLLLLRRAQTSELSSCESLHWAVLGCSLETHHNQSTQKLLIIIG